MRTRTEELEEIIHNGVGQHTLLTDNPHPTPDTEVTTDYPWSYCQQAGSAVMHDIVTPNFRKLMSKGCIINNPYDRTSTSSGEGYVLKNTEWYTRNYHSTIRYHNISYGMGIAVQDLFGYPSLLSYPSVDVEALTSLAITKAWSKVSAAPMQAFVSLAEMRETVSTIVELLHGIYFILRRVRKLRRLLSTGVITVAKATDLWLTYRYGLRPLFYDLQSAIEAINSIGTRPRTRFSARAVDESSHSDDVTWNVGNATYPAYWTVHREASTFVTASAGVLVESKIQRVSIPQALGLDEVLPTIWELVPYSFVVDWVFNTAQWVAALSPKADVVPLASWVVLSKTDERSNRVTDVDAGRWSLPSGFYWDTTKPEPVHSIESSQPHFERTTFKERIPQPSLPAIPSLNIRLDVAKVVDLLALIKQLF